MAPQLIATICLILGASAAVGAITAGSSLQGTNIYNLMSMPYRITMGMEVSNLTPFVLSKPLVTLSSGVITLNPVSIKPNYKEAMVARKTAHSATGTFGVVSWEIVEKSRRVVIMWSVPYDHNVYSNWLAVGVTKQNSHHDETWPNLMYWYDSNDQLEFNRQEYHYSSEAVSAEYGGLKISAEMTKSGHAVVTARVEKVG